jgi:hypothetical protein
MNVLIFDLNIYKNDLFDIVDMYLKEINSFKTNDKENFLSRLKSDIKYDLLIIDVSTSCGDYVFEEATKLNERYNILVLSNTLTYNSKLSCKACSLKYNRKLLLKPIKANDLVNYILNYDKLTCKYSIASNNIIEILEDVMKQFTSYSYDKNSEKIILVEEHSNIRELLNIVDLLNIHNIHYVINNDDINIIN